MKAQTSVMCRLLLGFSLFFAVSLSVLYFIGQVSRSSKLPLNDDEQTDLVISARNAGYLKLITKGPDLQPNPAPLGIIFIKLLDSSRHALRFLGLLPTSYLRIGSILGIILGGAGLLPFLFYMGRVKDCRIIALQCVLLLQALCSYLFSFYSLDFGSLLRSYPFWRGLTFLSYTLCIIQPVPLVVVLPLTALSMTSSTAIFQIFFLWAALRLTVDKKKNSSFFHWREVVIFGLPVLISIYYLGRVQDWSLWQFPTPLLRHFLAIWLKTPIYWLFPLAGIALTWFKSGTRRYGAPLLACFFIYMFGPVFYLMIRLKNYQLSYRYFSYYDLVVPIFLLTLIPCIGQWKTFTNKRKIMYAAFTIFPLIIFVPNIFYDIKSFWGIPVKSKYGILIDPKGVLDDKARSGVRPGSLVLLDGGARTQLHADLYEDWFAAVWKSRAPAGPLYVRSIDQGYLEVDDGINGN